MVTLDGALFEKSGTMSGGGSKPRGGKMGTSIRAASVSGEAVANAEKELAAMVDSLNNIRQQIAHAVRRYQGSEKAVARLEMELAKCQKEVILSMARWILLGCIYLRRISSIKVLILNRSTV